MKAVRGMTKQRGTNAPQQVSVDSASQNSFVTVRQMFSADPAPEKQALLWYFGGGPFPFPGCLALREVLMDTAPLSSDSILTAS